MKWRNKAIYLIYFQRKADIDVTGYGNFQNNEKQSSQFSHRINLIHCYVTDNSMSILCNLMRHIWFRRLHPASSMRKLFYFFRVPSHEISGKMQRTKRSDFWKSLQDTSLIKVLPAFRRVVDSATRKTRWRVQQSNCLNPAAELAGFPYVRWSSSSALLVWWLCAHVARICNRNQPTGTCIRPIRGDL